MLLGDRMILVWKTKILRRCYIKLISIRAGAVPCNCRRIDVIMASYLMHVRGQKLLSAYQAICCSAW